MLEPVEPIPAVAPRPSLLTTARPLPEGTRWQTGIAFRDSGAYTAGVWPYAPGASHADKSDYDPPGPQLVEVRPVTLYVPLSCDEVTMLREDELSAEARDELEAQTALRLARTLAGGVSGDEWANDPACNAGINPTLSQPYGGVTFAEVSEDGSTENDIVGAAGNHPVAGLGILIGAYTAATFKGGATVHVESSLIATMLAHGAIRQQGDIYVGPENSVIVPHAVLVGPASDDAGLPTANTAGNSWMYATGPVEYALGEPRVLPETRRERFFGARRTNQWSVLAERMAIVRFNPSVVKATQVLIPTTGT